MRCSMAWRWAPAVGALCAAVLASGQPAPATRPAQDLTVTVRHLDGREDTYGDELTSLDIVVGPDGRIVYLHAILISGEERDTHVWYNFQNVASLKYRFHTITGKAKVSLKHLEPLEMKPKPGLKKKIDPIDADDYK